MENLKQSSADSGGASWQEQEPRISLASPEDKQDPEAVERRLELDKAVYKEEEQPDTGVAEMTGFREGVRLIPILENNKFLGGTSVDARVSGPW